MVLALLSIGIFVAGKGKQNGQTKKRGSHGLRFVESAEDPVVVVS